MSPRSRLHVHRSNGQVRKIPAPNCRAHDKSLTRWRQARFVDRKSTRLNSSHVSISYAVFCLKKKKNQHGWRIPVGGLHLDVLEEMLDVIKPALLVLLLFMKNEPRCCLEHDNIDMPADSQRSG